MNTESTTSWISKTPNRCGGDACLHEHREIESASRENEKAEEGLNYNFANDGGAGR
jgi:hypothetical protein